MARCANGHPVRWGAKFCSVCGVGAPTGTILCGECGKEVRSSAKHCWNCGTKLSDVAPQQFDTYRWAGRPGDFAVRIDHHDIKRWFVKPLTIEAGTRALVFQNGRFGGELEEGRYDLGGFVSRLRNFMIDRDVSVVVMDAGDVSVVLENGVRSLDKGAHALEEGVRDLEKGVGDVETGLAGEKTPKPAPDKPTGPLGRVMGLFKKDDDAKQGSAFDKAQELEAAPGDLERGRRYPRPESLWTADRIEVGACSELVLRLGDGVPSAEAFFTNMMKGQARVSLAEVEEMFANEVHMLLRRIVAQYKAEQLFGNFDVRYAIEEQLREHLEATLGRLGLALVQLRFIDFTGPAYELIRQKHANQDFYEADAEVTLRRYRLTQRLRETESQDKMHAIKDGQDLVDFLRQTEHELGLKGVIREDEVKRLTERLTVETADAHVRLEERLRDERWRDHLIRMIEIGGIKDDFRRERAWKNELSRQQILDERVHRKIDRWKDVEEAKAEVGDVRRGTRARDHDEDVREARDGLDLLERTQDVQFKDDRRRTELEMEQEQHRVNLEGQTLEQRSKATVEALLSIVDNPAADHLAELEQLRVKQNMSPEQILTLTADASPHWAEALAERYKAQGELDERVREQLETRIREQRELGETDAQRLERVTNTALEQMGWVASTRSVPGEPAPVVFPPPGSAGRTSINIHSQISGSPMNCAKCGTKLDPEAEFCSKCGEKRAKSQQQE